MGIKWIINLYSPNGWIWSLVSLWKYRCSSHLVLKSRQIFQLLKFDHDQFRLADIGCYPLELGDWQSGMSREKYQWSLLILSWFHQSCANCVHLQGVPIKASHFQNAITLKIWGQKAQFSCFWNAEIYSYFFKWQIFKIKLACQDGVTEVNNTKSQTKFLHIAFCLALKVIFRLFKAKCGYSLRYWEL